MEGSGFLSNFQIGVNCQYSCVWDCMQFTYCKMYPGKAFIPYPSPPQDPSFYSLLLVPSFYPPPISPLFYHHVPFVAKYNFLFIISAGVATAWYFKMLLKSINFSITCITYIRCTRALLIAEILGLKFRIRNITNFLKHLIINVLHAANYEFSGFQEHFWLVWLAKFISFFKRTTPSLLTA